VAGWRQDHFHPKGSQKAALQEVTSIFRQKKMIWDPFMGTYLLSSQFSLLSLSLSLSLYLVVCLSLILILSST